VWLTAEARPSTGSGRGEPAEPRRTQRKSNEEIMVNKPSVNSVSVVNTLSE